MQPVYLQIASTLVSLAVGIGIAWGRMTKTTNKLDEMLPHLEQLKVLPGKVDSLSETLTEVRVEMASLKARVKGGTE